MVKISNEWHLGHAHRVDLDSPWAQRW